MFFSEKKFKKNFFNNRRIAKCKIPTINRMMKRSLMTGGYSSSKTLTKHSESDYEFGWGSDFDDDDNDDDFDDEIVDDEGVYEIEKLTNSNQVKRTLIFDNDSYPCLECVCRMIYNSMNKMTKKCSKHHPFQGIIYMIDYDS